MRVAVTGATGRLGRALVEALEDAPFTGPMGPIAWSRPELDLDTLDAAAVDRLIERDRPEVVIHAAAWTDVDGCARDPELAPRAATATRRARSPRPAPRPASTSPLVSTNEVFDGARTDGRGYAADDERTPDQPLRREQAPRRAQAWAAYAARGRRAWRSLRTSWLHGPPGNDFPEKIARAALRARDAGEPLKAVADEIGRPPTPSTSPTRSWS